MDEPGPFSLHMHNAAFQCMYSAIVQLTFYLLNTTLQCNILPIYESQKSVKAVDAQR